MDGDHKSRLEEVHQTLRLRKCCDSVDETDGLAMTDFRQAASMVVAEIRLISSMGVFPVAAAGSSSPIGSSF